MAAFKRKRHRIRGTTTRKQGSTPRWSIRPNAIPLVLLLLIASSLALLACGAFSRLSSKTALAQENPAPDASGRVGAAAQAVDAKDTPLTFPNGGTATLHADGSITGMGRLEGNWCDSQRMGHFGDMILPDGARLKAACYEIYIGDPNHQSYAVPADGSYPFTATPQAGGGYFVLMHTQDAGYAVGWEGPYPLPIQRTYVEHWNPEIQVEVTLVKASANMELTAGNGEYSLGGAVFDIFKTDGDVKVATVTTDSSGRGVCRLNQNTSYYAIETKAPAGFLPNPDRIPFQTGSTSITQNIANAPGSVRISIAKADAATGGDPQPGLSLAGAEYKAVDANGAAHVGTTDESGCLVFEGLPLGTTTIVETKAPEGYLPDTAQHVYKATAEQLPESGVIEIAPENDFLETPVAFDIELIKYKDSGTEGSGLQEPASGVSFKIISKSTNREIGELVTDVYGKATTSGGPWLGSGSRPEGVQGSIPYDREGYIVKEVASTTPDGYSPAPPWEIGPDQMTQGVCLHYIVDNDFVSSRIQIVKTDAASGATVPLAGFSFKVLDEDKNEITQENWYPNHATLTEFTTDETGCVTLPQALVPGTYYLRETAAAPPYLLNGEDIQVVIKGGSTSPVVIASVADEAAMGVGRLTKTCSETGEGLQGGEFDVVSRETITAPDGRVLSIEGEIVDHVSTDENGKAKTKKLPLGTGSARYAFVETKAPAGHVLDPTPHEFTLSFADSATDVVYGDVSLSNEAIETVIQKTSENGSALADASFALWRADDEIHAATRREGLLAIRSDAGHRLEAEPVFSGALIRCIEPENVSVFLKSAEGNLISADSASAGSGAWNVPAGRYTVELARSTKAGDGKAQRDGDATGDSITCVDANLELDDSSSYTLELIKTSGGYHAELSRESKVEATELAWSAEDGAYLGSDLAGRQRIFLDGREIGEIEVSGKAYAEVVPSQKENSEGKDETEEDDEYTLKRVPILLIGDKELNERTTDSEGTLVFRHLSQGDYRLAESSAPKGYLLDASVLNISVTPSGAVLVDGNESTADPDGADGTESDSRADSAEGDLQRADDVTPSNPLTIPLSNNYTKVEISKRDITNEKEVPGAHLAIYTDAGEMVAEWISEDKPKRIDMLEPGSYCLVEQMTPNGYDLACAVPFEVEATGDIQSVVMYDEPISITGQIDKRQQIAVGADPDSTETAAEPQKNASFDYTIDFRSTSSTWVDEFTVTDELEAVTEGRARLEGILTPFAPEDFDGKLNVWYRTDGEGEKDASETPSANATLEDGHQNPWLTDSSNKQALGDDGRRIDYAGWNLWAKGVSASEPCELDVEDLSLADNEKIVSIRFEFGRVEEGFSTRKDLWNRDDLKDLHDDLGREDGTGSTDSADRRGGAVLHMSTDSAYRPETDLANSCRIEMFRNGGGKGLEAFDEDRVVQSYQSTASILDQTGGTGALVGTGCALLAACLIVHGLQRETTASRARAQMRRIIRNGFGNRSNKLRRR